VRFFYPFDINFPYRVELFICREKKNYKYSRINPQLSTKRIFIEYNIYGNVRRMVYPFRWIASLTLEVYWPTFWRKDYASRDQNKRSLWVAERSCCLRMLTRYQTLRVETQQDAKCRRKGAIRYKRWQIEIHYAVHCCIAYHHHWRTLLGLSPWRLSADQENKYICVMKTKLNSM